MYKRLIEYYPDYLAEIREIRKIVESQQNEIDFARTAGADALSSQFIEELPLKAIERWEKILKIVPKTDDTPEERRFKILTRINGYLPYTKITLSKVLETLCGKDNFSVETDYNNYSVKIRIALISLSNYDDVLLFLNRIMPANMALDFSLMFNQYSMFSQLTHGQMNENTHYELRNKED